MTSAALSTADAAALVARPGVATSYLVLTPRGEADWTGDPGQATTFGSMREAARAAFRLPAGLRAFGLPRSLEIGLSRAH